MMCITFVQECLTGLRLNEVLAGANIVRPYTWDWFSKYDALFLYYSLKSTFKIINSKIREQIAYLYLHNIDLCIMSLLAVFEVGNCIYNIFIILIEYNYAISIPCIFHGSL